MSSSLSESYVLDFLIRIISSTVSSFTLSSDGVSPKYLSLELLSLFSLFLPVPIVMFKVNIGKEWGYQGSFGALSSLHVPLACWTSHWMRGIRVKSVSLLLTLLSVGSPMYQWGAAIPSGRNLLIVNCSSYLCSKFDDCYQNACRLVWSLCTDPSSRKILQVCQWLGPRSSLAELEGREGRTWVEFIGKV